MQTKLECFKCAVCGEILAGWNACGSQWKPYWRQVIPDGRYLVQRWDGNIRVQDFYHDDIERASTLNEWAKNVVAYMSLPEPYTADSGQEGE